MKPALIIKTGSTVQRVPRGNGDFEHWITAAMGLDSSQVVVADVVTGHDLPDPQSLAGVVITGSAAMVTDKLAWSEHTANWLRGLRGLQLPVLGICYGHQLVAHALGGVVDFHPQGREIGTACITQSAAAASDPLFAGLPGQFLAHVSHMQSVTCVPEHAVILASNNFEKHHAVRFDDNIWGVQFHPEFDVDVMLAYIDEREADLLAEGLLPKMLRENVRKTEDVTTLMRNFSRLMGFSV